MVYSGDISQEKSPEPGRVCADSGPVKSKKKARAVTLWTRRFLPQRFRDWCRPNPDFLWNFSRPQNCMRLSSKKAAPECSRLVQRCRKSGERQIRTWFSTRENRSSRIFIGRSSLRNCFSEHAVWLVWSAMNRRQNKWALSTVLSLLLCLSHSCFANSPPKAKTLFQNGPDSRDQRRSHHGLRRLFPGLEVGTEESPL